MLHLHSAKGVDPLVTVLTDVLSEPLADPMQPEWLAAPSQGLGRWLRLELSRRIGASVGRHDGIAANLEVGFPGSLVQSVTRAGRPVDSVDPWAIDRMVWVVLEVLNAHNGDPRLGPVATIPSGGTAFGQARRLADLIDRYGTHRPAMLRRWVDRIDVDGAGNPLGPGTQWQPELFRLVRARIGSPCPAEVLPDLLEQVRSGALALDLPPRLSLFGLTSVPGGATFLDLVDAVSANHEVHLFLVNPSPGMTSRVRTRTLARTNTHGHLRSDQPDDPYDGHPLLRSWSHPNREATVLWSQLEESTGTSASSDSSPEPAPTTLLTQVQADLRADSVPGGLFEPTSPDRSIEIHSCHGPTRQVEVLRDALLHRLNDDPTLREDQILVVCPSITTYAPLVESVFGRSAEFARHDAVSDVAPLLSYRVTDRSLRDTYGVLGSLSLLIDLIGGRFSASSVLDFIGQPPVRERYGFTDDEIQSITEWVSQADVRWGIDGKHRGRWGIPNEYEPGSWRAALDRMLIGVATSDDHVSLAAGDVLPLDIEGQNISTVGRFADLVGRIAELAETAATSRPIQDWCDLLHEIGDELFAATEDAEWQQGALHRLLQDIAVASIANGEASSVSLDLTDMSRVLGDALAGSPRRPDFFRGGITVSSLTPLRGVPFRVICILGMDDGAFGASGNDGDDLVSMTPHLGDRDARSDIRQALLETVLAAEEQLLITRTGHSVITNQEVPLATPLAELIDTVRATVTADSQKSVQAQLDVVHPRQSFDRCNFHVANGLSESCESADIDELAERCKSHFSPLHERPWSFDPSALDGALARSEEREDSTPFLEKQLEKKDTSVISLSDLHAVLAHPVKAFLTQRLGIFLPRDEDPGAEDLPTNLESLTKWNVSTRLLDLLLDGQDIHAWTRREQAIGSVPPGGLGDIALADVTTTVLSLVASAESVGYKPGLSTPQTIDIMLDDGTRIVGSVADNGASSPGPVQVSCSNEKPKHRLQAWLDLMALVAADPETDWQSVTINKADKNEAAVQILIPSGGDPEERRATAQTALSVAVDCYRRALVEPIPLFAGISAVLASGESASDSWSNFQGRGDSDDSHNRMVFGDTSYRDLISIPARPDDPPGSSAGRAQRFADHLWGALEVSLVDPDPAETSA